MEFGLLKHGGGESIADAEEPIDREAMGHSPDFCTDDKCFTAMLFHTHCETSWDSDISPFVQTKLSGHIVPLTDCDFITNVVGEIIGRIERVH